jgi:HEAT repeat protein
MIGTKAPAVETPTPTPTPTPEPTKPPEQVVDPKMIAEARQALKDPKSNTREEAARKLGSFHAKSVEAVPDLLVAMKDKVETVRAAAAEAIGKIVPKTPQAKVVVPALIEGLKDEFFKVRLECANSLGEIGADANPAALGPLTTVLATDEDAEVKRAAEKALRSVKSKPK